MGRPGERTHLGPERKIKEGGEAMEGRAGERRNLY